MSENKYPIGGYAPGEYNPIGCEHKLPNGLSSWSFQSEEQSNLGGQNKVSIHVCLLCGEINIGGYRPSKDEKHVNSFHETFHIYHPDAIDAIIKQANFFNEESKWGRLSPKPAGAVWVKASEFKHEPGVTYHAKDSKSKGAGRFYKNGDFVWGDHSFTINGKQDDLYILDESGTASNNDVIEFAEWLYKNRWFHFENGRWEYTFEQGSSVSRGEYLKNYIKTTADLHQLWQQSKSK